MKVKLDENIPRDVATLLRDRGMDVHTVLAESLGGSSDPTVLEAARVEERVVITLDRGFGDVRAYPPGSHPGSIVLRPDDQRPTTVTDLVTSLVEHHDVEALAGCIVVVQRNVLRIRRPEPR